jgi:hypothetical protein
VQDDGKPLQNGLGRPVLALLLLFDPCLMLLHEQARAWTTERHLNTVQCAFVCGLERMRWQWEITWLPEPKLLPNSGQVDTARWPYKLFANFLGVLSRSVCMGCPLKSTWNYGTVTAGRQSRYAGKGFAYRPRQ